MKPGFAFTPLLFLGVLLLHTGCSARHLVRQGDRYLQEGQPATAARFYERASVERPRDLSIQVRVARAWLAEAKPKLALGPARTAFTGRAPGATEVLLESLLGTGDLQGASEIVNQAQIEILQDPALGLLHARLALARGDTAASIQILDSALLRQEDTEQLAFKAWLLARQGRFEDSRALARRARSLAPEQREVIGDCAVVCLMLGLEDDRKSLVPSLVELFGGNPDDLSAQSRRHESNGDLVSALRYAGWSAAWKPNDGESLKRLGELFHRSGEYRWSVRFLEAALLHDPFKVDLGNKGLVRPIIIRSTEVASIYRTLASSFERLGEYENVGNAMQQSVLLTQSENPKAWLEVAHLFFKAGSHASASQAAQMVLRTDPRSVDAHLVLARVLALQGQTDTAIGHARLAWQSDPGDLQTALLLGMLYQRRQDFESARGVYGAALQRFPGNREILDARALLPPME